MKINKTIISLIILVLTMFFSVNSSYAVPPKTNLLPSDYTTGITWEKALKIKKPIIVNFYVDWCGYCRRFAPVLENLRKEYESKFTFVIINTDDPKNEKLVNSFMIKSFPSLFFVNPKNGRRVFVNQSIYLKPDLKKELDDFLKDYKNSK
ncbi:MAG: thioredoxin family protein [bacterium]